MDKPRVVFLLPGATFRKEFLESWTYTIQRLLKLGVAIKFRTLYSADIYMCRNSLLTDGDPVEDWEDQLPFGGEDYDFMFWIDSDTSWEPEDVLRLIAHDKDVVSGVVPIGTDMRAPMGYYGEDENGRKALQYIDVRQVKNVPRNGELLEVHFVGFAFICLKKGVMEAVGFPWFTQEFLEHGGRTLYTSEDTGWCHKARKKGIKIHVDPRVVLTHHKTIGITAQGPLVTTPTEGGDDRQHPVRAAKLAQSK